jgi:hypothetical protein
MPYKHAIKVSEEVYGKLWELTRKYSLKSPNQLLEKLLAQGATLSRALRVTPLLMSSPFSKACRLAITYS